MCSSENMRCRWLSSWRKNSARRRAKLLKKLLPESARLRALKNSKLRARDIFNARVNRAALALAVAKNEQPKAEVPSGKILVEHSSINPNKAAHIGHLRNAILGDTFVRLLQFAGRKVDVQNYIDNTGVQVADVVVGFQHIEKKSVADVERLASQPHFDYYCWDLYARASQWYEQDPENKKIRMRTLHEIEQGGNETAALAETISMQYCGGTWRRWIGWISSMTFCRGRAKFCICISGMRHLRSSNLQVCFISKMQGRIKDAG